MKSLNTLIICNFLLRCVAFICITVAAIQFDKVGVLWFYLVPFLMTVDYKKEKSK